MQQLDCGANGEAADIKEIARVFQKQRRFQQASPPSTLEERQDKLRRLRAALTRRRFDIQAALYADFRKAPEEVDLTEIQSVKSDVDYALKHLKTWMAPTVVSTPAPLLGTTSKVLYEPKGVVLILSPWNYPVNLTLGPLVSALAAGNAAILKPSELTPNATRLIADLVEELFDEREVALFSGDKAVAQALLDQPFDHMFFTGSPAVGKLVMKAAAEHLASVTLELGGKSPTIVDETAGVGEAARKIVWGKFTNAGQTCTAPDYLYVHEQVKEDLVYALKRHIRAFYGETDEAVKNSPDYARLVSDTHHARVQRLCEDALQEGAQLVCGGQFDPTERYAAPTLLTDVPPDAAVMKEEILGPVLPILTFNSLSEVVAAVGRKPNPLALYLFTQSEENKAFVVDRTTAGGTCINEVLLHYLNPELPFGGAGHSGVGRSHGAHGFKAFSNERAVLERTCYAALMQPFYPPYGPTARRLLDLMQRFL